MADEKQLDLVGCLFDGRQGARSLQVRERLAGDFVGRKRDADKYEAQLKRVPAALKAGG